MKQSSSYINIILPILFGIFALSNSITATTHNVSAFCDSGPQGTYCSEDSTGFYWCLEGQSHSQSSFFQCPSGTTCLCFQGPECKSVVTVGNGSPCGYFTSPSYFPTSYTATQKQNSSQHVPVGVIYTNSSRTLYVSGSLGKERIDTTSSISQFGQSPTTLNMQEYFILNANGNVTHYTYYQTYNSCVSEIIPGPLPNTRVPSDYQLWKTETINGQTYDVYIFRKDGRYTSYESGLHVELYTKGSNPSYPVFENVLNDRWRNGVMTNTTWTSFVVGEPAPSLFNLPSLCTL